MKKAENSVKEFHRKYGFPTGKRLGGCPVPLSWAADVVGKMSRNVVGDKLEQVRAHLILEEAAEAVKALAEGNELDLLDALADLTYVVVGTAVAFGLPLSEAFDEVHRSNMTKTAQMDRPAHPGKGDGYSPPDLGPLLKGAKDGQLSDDR